MSYTIYNANGTSTVVPDNAIDTEFYDGTSKVGVQLVGRNAIDFGQPIAQNFLQLLENFAGPTTPGSNGATAPVGMIWYNSTNGTLNVKTSTGWIPIVTSSSTGGAVTIPSLYATTIGSVGSPVSDIYGGIFHGTATMAEYADLAERYESDAVYGVGSVVALGGDKEITITTSYADTNVFGVISDAPGLMLNAAAGGDESHPYVAIAGRVPVNVIGKVKKGDRLVSSASAGFAESVGQSADVSVYAVIGRALESKDTDGEGKILAVVGAK